MPVKAKSALKSDCSSRVTAFTVLTVTPVVPYKSSTLIWILLEPAIIYFETSKVTRPCGTLARTSTCFALTVRDTLLTQVAAGLLEHVKNVAICLDLHSQNLEG